jgi:hypothetical protein
MKAREIATRAWCCLDTCSASNSIPLRHPPRTANAGKMQPQDSEEAYALHLQPHAGEGLASGRMMRLEYRGGLVVVALCSLAGGAGAWSHGGGMSRSIVR